MRHQAFAVLTASLILGYAVGESIEAKTIYKGVTIPGGGVCQPSIPSSAAGIAQRANGFRNEGTTSVFAICGFPLPEGVNSFTIYFWSLDGTDRSFNCTATDGLPIYGQQYSVKTISTSGGQGYQQWDDSDFNGNAGDKMHGYHSITCNLPSQMSVIYFDASYNDEVGR